MVLQRLLVDAVCDAGLKRSHNEDMAAIDGFIFRDGAYQMEFEIAAGKPLLLAVADGIGGANAGEIASQYVLHELVTAKNGMPAGADAAALQEYFSAAAAGIHEQLLEQGRLVPGRSGMGATVVAVVLEQGRAFYLSAGDSRLYRYRRGRLRQISRDHSIAGITGINRGSTHAILNSIGGGETVFIDFADISAQLANGDCLLLCSDGLTDMADDERIEDALTNAVSAAALCALAKEHGGKDNISILLATVVMEENEEREV